MQPDSEEHNEMVFCDQCNICVHQACYGITHIPAGQWLCRTCSLGTQPKCELCPNRGGAMKSTKSGQKWAHVSCALWIPEVSIGCVEKMEPITKISSIPVRRRRRRSSSSQCSKRWHLAQYRVNCQNSNYILPILPAQVLGSKRNKTVNVNKILLS